MAFPTYTQTNSGSQASLVTSFNITMPGTTIAGRLLLAFIGSGSNTSNGKPADWMTLYNTAGNPGIYYKFADGTEGGTTPTFTQSSGGWWKAQVLEISGAHASSPPEVSTQANGTTSTPNPPAATPSWGAEDNLFIEVLAMTHLFGTDRTVSSWSTNYTGSTGGASDGGTAGDGGQDFIDFATRNLNATTDDPGDITLSGAINAWKTVTVVVRPAAAAVTLRALATLGVGT